MFILPLHRKWSRSNFPLATILLVIANVFVYAFLQSGDERVEKQAVAFYEQSDLASVEFPAYARWLDTHGRAGEAREDEPGGAMLGRIESDSAFLADLHADKVIAPTDEGYADWHGKRAQFDAILDSAFTSAHDLRQSHFEPGRILTSMFMHGGFEHIFGNMLFLLVIGMLVEGALGPGWFLVLYMAGGIGAALTTLAWHWGTESPPSLGASGAIAALMGAYCMIWGRRKVKVFYWFFVVFDYVKVPALIMLGFWFVGLVLLPWLDQSSHVDFADHAGGLLCGVAMAFALRREGKVRNDFVEEEQRIERHQLDDAAFEQAQQMIGQLEIPKAREILLRLDKAEPGQLRVLIALYRCARYRGTPEQLDAAAARVFAFPALADTDVRELKSVHDDYVKACGGSVRLSSDVLLRLLPIWERCGDDSAADALLRTLIAREPANPALSAAWFGLALRTQDGTAARRDRLEFLLQHYPQSDYAPKARFLLGQA
ncbi:MAG TPA: rhomboid family intramembrane serine protease [Xanthomonadaceae bacterium]